MTKLNRERVALMLCAATAALTDCGGNSGAPVAPISATTGTNSPSPVPSASPRPSATPAPSPTPAPSARPTASPAPTASPTASAASSIYVANSSDNSITVYPANPSGTLNETPSASIAGTNTGLELPYGVAVDASGKIYVANRTGGSGSGSVTVFAAHPSGMLDETPLATITGSNTGLANPSAIALDTAGRIYVANSAAAGGGSVTVYAANPSGTLNETPIATIAGGNTGLDAPDGVAFDGGANIYITNENGGPGGNGSVTEYAANPSGALNEAPLATIAGSNTGLHNPIGLALDAAGRIDVVDFFTSSLTVYAANPSGSLNEAPLATISGSTSLLGSPDGIALDANGKLYVANGYGAITVYAASPIGTIDEAPLGTITGDTTSLFGPVGVAIH